MNIPPTFLDDPSISETFVDSIGMNTCDGRIARVELCITRLDRVDDKKPVAKFTQRPACRLVMPFSALVELSNELQRMVATIKQETGKSGGQAN